MSEINDPRKSRSPEDATPIRANGFTTKEIVLAVWADVREIRNDLNMIQRDGTTAANVVREEVEDHESRLRKIEFRIWSIPGVAALTAVGLALNFFFAH